MTRYEGHSPDRIAWAHPHWFTRAPKVLEYLRFIFFLQIYLVLDLKSFPDSSSRLKKFFYFHFAVFVLFDFEIWLLLINSYLLCYFFFSKINHTGTFHKFYENLLTFHHQELSQRSNYPFFTNFSYAIKKISCIF